MWSVFTTIIQFIPRVLGIIEKKIDVDLEKYKVDGVVNVEALKSDVEIIKARAALAEAMKDDLPTRVGRGALIGGTGLWFLLILWDSCFRNLMPEVTWRVLALPESIQYLPYAVVAYLFVTAWKK